MHGTHYGQSTHRQRLKPECDGQSTLKQWRSDDESREGADTGDPVVNFEQETSQTEDEEDEDIGLPPELERIIAQEDREMRQHQEETELVDLGAGSERKEVKVGTGMTPLSVRN